MGGGVGENYLPQESSTVLSKSSKLAWAPPITPIVQATSLWARLWFSLCLHLVSQPPFQVITAKSLIHTFCYKRNVPLAHTYSTYPWHEDLSNSKSKSPYPSPQSFLFKIIQHVLLPLHILHSCENLVTPSFEAWKGTPFGYILIYAITGNTPWAYTWSPLLPLKTGSHIKI